jgi:hypothetical protein
LLIAFEAEATTCPLLGAEIVFDDDLIVNEESDIQRVCSPEENPNLELTEDENAPREAHSTGISLDPVDGKSCGIRDERASRAIAGTEIVDDVRRACDDATETITPLSPAPRCSTLPLDDNCESDIQNVAEADDARNVSLEAALNPRKPNAEPRMRMAT